LTLFDPDLTAAPGAAAEVGSVREPVATAQPVTTAQPSTTAQPGTTVEPATTDPSHPRGAVPAVTTRLRLTISYDGAGFRGFAVQPGQRTVAGVLGEAIAVVVGHRVELVCAGRTDAGVHARGQVVHVDVGEDTDTVRLVRSVNTLLKPAVVIRSAEIAPPGFDARRSARARRYRYLVLEHDTPDPLLAPVSWHVPGPLDLRAMAAAADALLGEHDFRAFCRRVPGTAAGTPIMRRVLDARFSGVPVRPGELGPDARLLRFDIEATSFCHQMVRSVVGTLVEVGRGRRRASDVKWLLQSGDRSRVGGVIAPPQGLCLVGVAYDP
jgi:tRNA pseudouridine38-40 synthase